MTSKKKFKRHRQGQTNYKKRYLLLLSQIPRFCIRITNTKIIAQLIEYKDYKDKTICSFSSDMLSKYKWIGAHKNIPCAYLTGFVCAKLCLEKNIKKAVVDIGLKKAQKGGRLFGCVKGAIDAGLDLNAKKEMFPKEDILNGKFIKKEKLFLSVFENMKASK
ncbi:MAG: 50S ribosomal protein L18 [Candidatus Aenigmarchaeota archaeon ex4484_52]|nr:MAG: 50S ribosomal protein L18 [Candidatus Aenigmarchaeota archaeon ex4484_52]